ncbi:MAG: Radical SAM domain protein [Methanothrix harundinacea]|uniref:Radical SAM domain protein n=1 Tax=Methanothrix harundinacea TaxID=301375 RepID=A0A101FRM2_9EURY|nr:MAG: Radical SAM domain protein [Methanothrix harundinacea]
MKTTIVSPKIYTYGSLVLGGILRDRGHAVTITRDLSPTGNVTLLSLFSTSQLLDPKIREFARQSPKIYVGGPVGLVPEIVLGELKVDGVVMGEGEDVVIDLIEQGPSEEIPGVAFLSDGEVVKTDPVPVSDLNHVMPHIPEDLRSQNVRGANVYIETHRGCLGGCTFCQVPRFFGRSIRSRSLENILAEVREMKPTDAASRSEEASSSATPARPRRITRRPWTSWTRRCSRTSSQASQSRYLERLSQSSPWTIRERRTSSIRITPAIIEP